MGIPMSYKVGECKSFHAFAKNHPRQVGGNYGREKG